MLSQFLGNLYHGKDFQEIARALDITPAEAAKLWVSVEKAHERFKQKEKVVYRKRLTNVDAPSLFVLPSPAY
ncbi:hypothetical protein vBKpnAMK6_00465 [Klebsiella phage vB_Kpn_AM_K6]